MLLATLVLLCPLPQSGDVAKPVVERSAAVSAEETKHASTEALPSVPEPKIDKDEDANGSNSGAGVAPAGDAIVPAGSLLVKPVKPAFQRDYDTRRQKKQWYALSIASAGAASFDAWSTRRAISGGYGTESNPFLAPFAKSNALYAATQVSPAVMDFIGRKLMTSRNPTLRKLWWLPQTAGMSFSVFAGVHNVRLAH